MIMDYGVICIQYKILTYATLIPHNYMADMVKVVLQIICLKLAIANNEFS